MASGDTLGLYLTGHPIDEYEEELQRMHPNRISALRPGKESATVSGMVVGMRVMKNKRGESFAFLTLDDKSGRLEVSVFAEKFNVYRDILVKDALLVVQGGVSEDSFTGGLKNACRVYTVDLRSALQQNKISFCVD